MARSCNTCRHNSKPIVDEPCNSCVATNGVLFTKWQPSWQPAHSCSTCKHCDKKITEEPCLDCDIRMRNDKWEARDE